MMLCTFFGMPFAIQAAYYIPTASQGHNLKNGQMDDDKCSYVLGTMSDKPPCLEKYWKAKDK